MIKVVFYIMLKYRLAVTINASRSVCEKGDDNTQILCKNLLRLHLDLPLA